MFTGRRNGQASSCCSNCSRSILQGASSRCCFFVSVRLLPSFRGEAVGVAGSDELTSSTCVFDAVDGVGLRRKTTEKLFARLTSVLQEVSRHKKPLDECARTNRISIQSCVRLRRVRCSRWNICVLSLTFCLSFALYYFFRFIFRPLLFLPSLVFFPIRHTRSEGGSNCYTTNFSEKIPIPPQSAIASTTTMYYECTGCPDREIWENNIEKIWNPLRNWKSYQNDIISKWTN